MTNTDKKLNEQGHGEGEEDDLRDVPALRQYIIRHQDECFFGNGGVWRLFTTKLNWQRDSLLADPSDYYCKSHFFMRPGVRRCEPRCRGGIHWFSTVLSLLNSLSAITDKEEVKIMTDVANSHKKKMSMTSLQQQEQASEPSCSSSLKECKEVVVLPAAITICSSCGSCSCTNSSSSSTTTTTTVSSSSGGNSNSIVEVKSNNDGSECEEFVEADCPNRKRASARTVYIKKLYQTLKRASGVDDDAKVDKADRHDNAASNSGSSSNDNTKRHHDKDDEQAADVKDNCSVNKNDDHHHDHHHHYRDHDHWQEDVNDIDRLDRVKKRRKEEGQMTGNASAALQAVKVDHLCNWLKNERNWLSAVRPSSNQTLLCRKDKQSDYFHSVKKLRSALRADGDVIGVRLCDDVLLGTGVGRRYLSDLKELEKRSNVSNSNDDVASGGGGCSRSSSGGGGGGGGSGHGCQGHMRSMDARICLHDRQRGMMAVNGAAEGAKYRERPPPPSPQQQQQEEQEEEEEEEEEGVTGMICRSEQETGDHAAVTELERDNRDVLHTSHLSLLPSSSFLSSPSSSAATTTETQPRKSHIHHTADNDDDCTATRHQAPYSSLSPSSSSSSSSSSSLKLYAMQQQTGRWQVIRHVHEVVAALQHIMPCCDSLIACLEPNIVIQVLQSDNLAEAHAIILTATTANATTTGAKLAAELPPPPPPPPTTTTTVAAAGDECDDFARDPACRTGPICTSGSTTTAVEVEVGGGGGGGAFGRVEEGYGKTNMKNALRLIAGVKARLRVASSSSDLCCRSLRSNSDKTMFLTNAAAEKGTTVE